MSEGCRSALLTTIRDRTAKQIYVNRLNRMWVYCEKFHNPPLIWDDTTQSLLDTTPVWHITLGSSGRLRFRRSMYRIA